MKFSNRKRRRGKNSVDLNATDNQEIINDVAFPSAETIDSELPPAAERLSSDANEKKRIASAVQEIPEIFKPEQVAWVFDAYVAILCFVYSIILKTDFVALQKELSFDEEEKKIMAEPLAKICSKYCPSEWAGMSSEIQLITSLSIWTVTSFKRAKNVAQAEQEKARDRHRTQPVSPMPRPVETHVPA